MCKMTKQTTKKKTGSVIYWAGVFEGRPHISKSYALGLLYIALFKTKKAALKSYDKVSKVEIGCVK